MARWLRGLRDAPETNVALFAFLLNFPWEFWQVPFYAGIAQSPHWHAVERCTQAAAGDATVAVLAFWGVAAFATRSWPLRPTARTTVAFVAIGLIVTIGVEWWSTEVVERWAYAATMPRLPLIGTGLLPILQWLLLPLLVIWFVRRQLT